jgi:predicted nucleic acid-binding Zn ribbon protein
MPIPPRKKAGPSRIGDLLKDFLQESMPKSLGDELQIFGAWPAAVGVDISRQAQPKSFRNGILFVETRHSIWTTELTARRHKIQKKLNQALGKEVVKEIHFRQAKV